MVEPQAPAARCGGTASPKWRRGFDNQRIADLGDGRFINPVLAGNWPDPAILKDGKDYYLTSSSFDSYPGLLIWHSRDLVNWRPLACALTTQYRLGVGAQSAQGRRAIPAVHPREKSQQNDIYVCWSNAHRRAVERTRRHWACTGISTLVSQSARTIRVGCFFRVAIGCGLSDDASVDIGAVEHVYDPWRYPQDWIVEGFSPEGPEDSPHRALVLPAHRRRRYGRAAHGTYGDRCSLIVAAWAMGTSSA